MPFWLMLHTGVRKAGAAVWSLLGGMAQVLAAVFLSPVLGRVGALLLLIVVAALAWQTMQLDGLRAWVRHDQQARAAAIAAARADLARRSAAAARISDQVGTQVESRQAQILTVTRTLIQEVPVYVTAQADRAVTVPVGFVRLHDAAARGEPLAAVPAGPAGAADAPSGVALSAVAATVVDNYGTCLVLREQVIGWQAWYGEQKAIWEARGPPPAK